MTVSLIRATGVVPGVSLGWMVVRFVYVIRVPVCARVSLVCPVCVVWCLFTGTGTCACGKTAGLDQWSCSARSVQESRKKVSQRGDRANPT